LSFSIHVPVLSNAEQYCPTPGLKRITDESGNFVFSDGRKFFSPDTERGGILTEKLCYSPDTTYENQKLLFTVKPTDTDFIFTADDESATVFTVSIDVNGNISVVKACNNEDCTDTNMNVEESTL